MNLITPTEMHVDDVDSGAPLLTFDASSVGGPGPITYALSRDAVRGLVDALSGVAPVAPGEVRLTVKADVSALRDGSWVRLSLETPSPTPAAPTGQPQPVWRVVDGEGAWWWFWPETDCFGAKIEQPCRGCGRTAPHTPDRVADERASLRRIREMLAPMLGLGVDEEPAEVMVDRATRIPRLAVLLGCPAETIARGWTVQRPQPRGDGTWFPGAILAGHECKEWGTSLDVPDGTVGDSERGLDVALSLLEAS